ncbi:YncE family protein [Armatimonas rosea]|uniref:YVTN family beta-propeller protein n=1 Tax=Armatimonas rosea TaxID=685828 RepID=A0A7W9WA86_ARMRO|nr:YncE family protein [Armatimonas rosea]MBB6054061.1 YVTN family beta-propeller protein [Armatimonas rosea]
MKTLLALLPIALTISVLASTHTLAQEPKAPSYHLLTKVAVGGEGAWDYLTVDSDAHRLYVTRSTHVMVMDSNTNKLVGDITNTPGVHGVALAPKLGRGFISNGRENTVLVFDLKTLKEIQRIPVGKNPDAILYDPATNRVFTFNGTSNDVTALDATTGKVLATIPAGGKPEFAVTDEKGMVYFNVEDTSELLAMDAKGLKIKSRWKIAPGEEASGLAFDKAHRHLFAVCGNEKMAVVDADSGKVLATPTIGKGPDAAAFDAKQNLAFSSNGADGTLTLVETKTFKAIGTVPTQTGARTLTIDPKTGKLYLISAKFKPAEPGQRRPSMEPGSAVILVYGR